jgi:hypothetical protein
LASYRSQITCISTAKLERSLKEAPCQAVSHAAAAPPTCHETPLRDAAVVKLVLLIVTATNTLPCRVYRNLVWTFAVSTDSHTPSDSGHHSTAIQPNRNSCKQESSLSDHPSGYQTKLKQQFDRGIGSTAIRRQPLSFSIPTRKAILSLSPSFHFLPLRFASPAKTTATSVSPHNHHLPHSG